MLTTRLYNDNLFQAEFVGFGVMCLLFGLLLGVFHLQIKQCFTVAKQRLIHCVVAENKVSDESMLNMEKEEDVLTEDVDSPANLKLKQKVSWRSESVHSLVSNDENV